MKNTKTKKVLSERPGLTPKRPDSTPSLNHYFAVDGGSDSAKPVVAVRPLISEPKLSLIRIERRTPKTQKLSKTKSGDQKFVYTLEHPEEWEIIHDTLGNLFEGKLRGQTARIEPFFGSYHKDNTLLIQQARENSVNLITCDSMLSARARIRLKIPKEEVTDTTDAVLLWFGNPASFGKAKLSSEKIQMDRSGAKKVLEASEESGWNDGIAKEALSLISLSNISEKFGEDLATPVFIVTAYIAAKDPQCKTRRDFDRFCGLAAKFRRGKKGVGSVISSNLSHFNNNPANRKAARFIFHKVVETR